MTVQRTPLQRLTSGESVTVDEANAYLIANGVEPVDANMTRGEALALLVAESGLPASVLLAMLAEAKRTERSGQ